MKQSKEEIQEGNKQDETVETIVKCKDSWGKTESYWDFQDIFKEEANSLKLKVDAAREA